MGRLGIVYGRILWIISLSLMFYFPSAAQESNLRFRHFDEIPELSQGAVLDVVFDKSGFLWVGTQNGLYRYDGYNIIQVYSGDAGKNKKTLGFIACLFTDSRGYIWVGTNGNGLFRVNPITFKAEDFGLLIKSKTSLSEIRVRGINEDKHGSIWIAAENYGVIVYPRNGIGIRYYFAGTKNILANNVEKIILGSKSQIWLHTVMDGQYFYMPESDSFLRYNAIEMPEISTYLGSLCNEDFYRYQLFGENGRLKILGKTEKAAKFEEISGERLLSDKLVTHEAMVIEKSGDVWWGKNGKGLIFFDLHKGVYKQFQHHESDPGSLSNSFVFNLLRDSLNNLWISTGKGLNRTNILQQDFGSYTKALEKLLPDQSKNIRSIYEDNDGKMWLGTEGLGLICVPPDGKSKIYTMQNTEIKTYGFNLINTIYEDSGNILWVGTPMSIYKFDKVKGKFTSKYFNFLTGNKEKSKSVWAISRLSKSALLVGTKDNGLLQLDPETRKYKDIPLEGKGDKPGPKSVWTIYKDKNHVFWMGTSLGLLKMECREGVFKFTNYFAEPEKPGALTSGNIFHILEDSRGRLWLSTSEGGLCVFDRKSALFRNISTADGLPSNSINGCYQDNFGNIWAVTSNGLAVIDSKSNKVIKVFSVNDGLPGNHLTCISKGIDGNIVIGGKNGITRFKPKELKPSNFNSPIVITSFKVLFQDFTRDLIEDSMVVLDYKQHSFTMEFASLDYTNPGNNRFAYKLEGLDDNWTYSEKNHFASFSNLSPGRYTILIKGTNNEGTWSNKIFRGTIIIEPPFWQTLWFKGMLGCIFALTCVFAIFDFRQRNFNKRRRLQAELESLRAQLNPHFVFNSLNSLQSFIISSQEEPALEYVAKFARLMRMILENSKRDLITLKEEIEFLKLYIYMESIRVSDNVDFRLETDPVLELDNVMIPGMTIQPLIENCIKHGIVARKPDGYIIISFKMEGKYLVSMVEDNGIGRKKAAENALNSSLQSTSVGLNIIKERLDLLNRQKALKSTLTIEDLYDKNGDACGTRIIMKTPLTLTINKP